MNHICLWNMNDISYTWNINHIQPCLKYEPICVWNMNDISRTWNYEPCLCVKYERYTMHEKYEQYTMNVKYVPYPTVR